jgi:endo-1,4-beta-xylanase
MHGRRRPCYEPLAAAWRWWSCPDDAHNRKLGRGGDAGNISVSAASDRRYPLLQMCQPRDNSALETVDPPAVSLGEPPPASDLAPTPARPQSRLAAGLLLLEARILLALAQVFYAGYGLGVGNQTIQIPFLHHHINPDLYAKDPAIQTARDYPSFFFHGLAWLARRIEIPRLYLSLHLLTTLAVLAAGYALARTISGLHAAGIVMVLLLLGGHHRALAGDEMYSLGFTHTWAVFPLAIVAILLLYRGWTMAAFALAGAIFNLHALTAAYLGAMFGFWAACEALRREGIALWRQSRPHLDADPSTAPLSQDGRLSVPDDAEPAVSSSGRGARLGRAAFQLAALMAAFLIPALPTMWFMASHSQEFSAEWVRWTMLRSPDHSFPTSWWQVGSSELPRFVLICGLAAVALGFPMEPQQRRKGILLAGAVGILFVIGFVFSEILPVAQVIRAQLFRSSRLLMVIALAHIAMGIVRGWRELWTSRGWALPGGALEFAAACATLAAVAVPPLVAYLPHALALLLVAALVNGRLAWPTAAFGGTALLLTVVAWHQIEFAVPGLATLTGEGALVEAGGLRQAVSDAALMVRDGAAAASQGLSTLSAEFFIALAAGVGSWMIWRVRTGAMLRWLTAAEGALAIGLLLHFAAPTLLSDPPGTARWIEAQRWVAANTPPDAVLLTPPEMSGFRIHSQRSIVGEWRDGTQMYFTAAFADEWSRRMQDLRPEMLVDTRGRQLLLPGKRLHELTDEQLIELAGKYGASYIVLAAGAERNLDQVYSNRTPAGAGYSVYRPQTIVPPEAVSKDVWLAQRRFMEEVVEPNIERYRKAEARIEVVDAAGRPLAGAAFQVVQTRQSFGFGCSLPFFAPVEGSIPGDHKPAVVTQKELDRFLEIFNYSTIPFSGKWGFVEFREGQRRYEDLDKYIDWCAAHDIQIEFHYLSGLWPQWFRSKPREQQGKLFFEHAMDLVRRYGDRVKIWQVVNDAYLLEHSPPVFEAIRAMYPDAVLGISHCTHWWAADARNESRLETGLRDVQWLAAQKVKLDYYAPHGHAPHRVWADARQIYEILDNFAKEGVRLRVSEAMLPLGPINGPVRRGQWTEELRAEYLAQFYTVLFSHPKMDAINYWNLGPDAAQEGAGLLDDNYEPKPAFQRLKELIRGKWMTRLSGTLDRDGQIAFRGFHGDYELRLTPAGGRTFSASFRIPQPAGGQSPDASGPLRCRFVYDAGPGTLRLTSP